MIDSIQNKGILSSMVSSLNKRDVKSFENLIRFFEEQSWMLCDVFVEVAFYSKNMIDFCKSNMDNINIRPVLLYYLCTFEPEETYFEPLLQLPCEERKYTLYCLKNLVVYKLYSSIKIQHSKLF